MQITVNGDTTEVQGGIMQCFSICILSNDETVLVVLLLVLCPESLEKAKKVPGRNDIQVQLGEHRCRQSYYHEAKVTILLLYI